MKEHEPGPGSVPLVMPCYLGKNKLGGTGISREPCVCFIDRESTAKFCCLPEHSLA